MVASVDVLRRCNSCGKDFPNTSLFWYAAGKNHQNLMHRGCPVVNRARIEGTKTPRLANLSNTDLIREIERRKLDLDFERIYARFYEVFQQFKPEWREKVVERLLESIGEKNNAR